MDSSAEDGGGPPTALAHGPGSPDSASPSPAAPAPASRRARPRRPRLSQPPGPPEPAVPRAAHGRPPRPRPGRTRARPAPAKPPQRTPAPRRRTDGVAVATLVSGLVPAIPVTLILGPTALIRIGRSGARGRALAITGLVLAGLWTVAARDRGRRHHHPAAAAQAGHAAPRVQPAGRRVPQLGHATGSAACRCSAAPRPTTRRYSPRSGWPARTTRGPRPCSSRPAKGCASRLSGYLNPQLSAASLAQSFVYPGAGAWSAGERTVVCTVHSTSGPLVGSVRSAPG